MKPKIGIYGRMNAGKSSLLNFLTGQSVAIVSPHAGTTTDPVRRAYELPNFGAVTFVDTAGFDDTATGRAGGGVARGGVAALRVEKTLATLDEVDLALFVPSAQNGQMDDGEQNFIALLDIPYIIVSKPFSPSIATQIIAVLRSSLTPAKSFFGSHLAASERVLLVCPIDSEAPEGRLILPQVQALRAALDIEAMAMVVQPSQVAQALKIFDPNLVVVDSQVFGIVAPIIPPGVELTSFSILLSEMKGDPQLYRQGLSQIDKLEAGAQLLIIEHCSHGVSCHDIARVKIPQMLQQYVDRPLHFTIVSGREPLPADLSQYSLAIQCGACMVGPRAIQSRINRCQKAKLPITSFGMLLQYIAKT